MSSKQMRTIPCSRGRIRDCVCLMAQSPISAMDLAKATTYKVRSINPGREWHSSPRFQTVRFGKEKEVPPCSGEVTL